MLLKPDNSLIEIDSINPDRTLNPKWIIDRRYPPISDAGTTAFIYHCSTPLSSDRFAAKVYKFGNKTQYMTEVEAFNRAQRANIPYLVKAYANGYIDSTEIEGRQPVLIESFAKGNNLVAENTLGSIEYPTIEKIEILKQYLELLDRLREVGTIQNDCRIDSVFYDSSDRRIEVVDLGYVRNVDSLKDANQLVLKLILKDSSDKGRSSTFAALIYDLFEGTHFRGNYGFFNVNTEEDLNVDLMPKSIRHILFKLAKGKYNSISEIRSELDTSVLDTDEIQYLEEERLATIQTLKNLSMSTKATIPEMPDSTVEIRPLTIDQEFQVIIDQMNSGEASRETVLRNLTRVVQNFSNSHPIVIKKMFRLFMARYIDQYHKWDKKESLLSDTDPLVEDTLQSTLEKIRTYIANGHTVHFNESGKLFSLLGRLNLDEYGEYSVVQKKIMSYLTGYLAEGNMANDTD